MRSDKVIVFSDNIFALRSYAVALNKPFIYGATSHAERTRVLHAFKHSATVSSQPLDAGCFCRVAACCSVQCSSRCLSLLTALPRGLTSLKFFAQG